MADRSIGPAEPGPFDRKAPAFAPEEPLRRRLVLGERAPIGWTPVCGNADVVVSLFELPVGASLRCRLRERRRRRPALRLLGPGHPRDAVRRPRRRGRGLRPRSAERRPPLAGLRAALRNRVRAPGRLSRSRAVPQPGRPAPDGRSLYSPRLQAPRLPRPATRPAGDPRQEGRPVRPPRAGGIAVRRRRMGRHRLAVRIPDPFVPAEDGPRPPPSDDPLHIRRARGPRLLLRSPRDGLPPRGDPLPLPALLRRLRRADLLRSRQLHEPARRGAEGGLAPPRGNPARPAPGSLRGLHRDAVHRRARRHDRHVPSPPRHASRRLALEHPGYHDSWIEKAP